MTTERGPTDPPEAPTPRRVYLGLGSNLGNRVARITDALDALTAGGVVIEAVSALYETPPWGVTDQPAFLNAAARGATTLEATAILALAKHIEAAAGRDFDAPRWTARPIDVDLLLIEGETVASEQLTVPHPLLHERAFVLVPLAGVAPEVTHPHRGHTVARLLAALPEEDRAGVVEVEPAGWYRPLS